MAVYAGGREGRVHILVVFLMARVAVVLILRYPDGLEIGARMARRTVQAGVCAHKREARSIVIEVSVIPRGCCVAVQAGSWEVGVLVLVLLLMAREAVILVGRNPYRVEVGAGMTFGAAQADMCSDERESGCVVIEVRIVPRGCIVAVQTGGREVGVLVLVLLLVARETVVLACRHPDRVEFGTDMARRARQADMRTDELETVGNSLMIECCRKERARRVALLAVRRKARMCVLVIRLMAGQAVVLIDRIKDGTQVSRIVARRATEDRMCSDEFESI